MLKAFIDAIRNEFIGTKIVIGGDFNNKKVKLEHLIPCIPKGPTCWN